MSEARSGSSSELADPQLVLQLDGFEGPLDLLLDLARRQKVDLARISILSLVEQYLALVEGARRIRLELAGDWLVMAAWLAWLKSRLLLPDGGDGAEEAEDAAGQLAARLDELEHVQRAARWLAARPRLGQDVFPRGRPENLVAINRSGLRADVPALLRGYLTARRRGGARTAYRPPRLPPWTVADALARLARMLGRLPPGAWTALHRLLPSNARTPAARRAALASTLVAGLELARDGRLVLRQDEPFGPVLVRGGKDAHG